MLAASANEGAVLSDRDLHAEHYTVLKRGDGLLELRLELCDELGLATETDLVARLPLAGATYGLGTVNMSDTKKHNEARTSESNLPAPSGPCAHRSVR